ncbi:MAG: DUF4432 family protein [Ruminococcaceae bacterium]|nr:DUF4432 family protein [Oscillospiraceae bacterium]
MLCSDNIKFYMGDPLQVRGAEELVLRNNAKGNGMRFLYIRNGLGLEVFLSLDRAGDAVRVNFKGDNLGFFAPCGFVSPQYFDVKSNAFLKSFTAGFFTTCGLTNVGNGGFDGDEIMPKHGTVSNTPAKLISSEETDDGLTVKLQVKDASLFGTKLVLNREFFFSYLENAFTLKDTAQNVGDIESPYMVLYHCNMGYPLLSENAVLKIPGNVTPYNEWAAQHLESALKISPPEAEYISRCYYYDVAEKKGMANVGIFNGDINKGLVISYDKKALPRFTQWKMLGKYDYVLGLEPSNCSIEGRLADRKKGVLKTLKPDEKAINTLKFIFVDDKRDFEEAF